MDKKIKEIIADMLEVNMHEITNESSPESIESWDSLKQMNIIVALEEELEIEFSDEEIAEMNSVALIKLIVEEKFKV